MQKTVIVLALALIHTFGYSQKEFFHSEQKFTEKQLNAFFSSVSVDSSHIYFIANDYFLYAYDRQTGQQKWSTSLNYKSNIPPFVHDNVIYSTIHKEKSTSAVMINANNGELIRELPVEMLESKPLIKDGVLYGTAIYEGGCLFAYDTRKDTILWWKFLAHGVSVQPYFFNDYIQANAESDNWVKINYQGGFVDTTCKVKADIFVSDIPCIKKFNALTHDGFEINGKLAKSLFGDDNPNEPEMLTTRKASFVLYENKLSIIGNKGKLKEQIDIDALVDSISDDSNETKQLLEANEEKVSFFYNNHLYTYNYGKKKLENVTNLSAWQPFRIQLDKDQAWIISRNDGRLYGLQL